MQLPTWTLPPTSNQGGPTSSCSAGKRERGGICDPSRERGLWPQTRGTVGHDQHVSLHGLGNSS